MRFSILPVLALLGAAPPPPGPPEAKWQRIFDGKTLAGWTPKITGRAVGEDPLGMFTVHEGAIRVSHANYQKFEASSVISSGRRRSRPIAFASSTACSAIRCRASSIGRRATAG